VTCCSGQDAPAPRARRCLALEFPVLPVASLPPSLPPRLVPRSSSVNHHDVQSRPACQRLQAADTHVAASSRHHLPACMPPFVCLCPPHLAKHYPPSLPSLPIHSDHPAPFLPSSSAYLPMYHPATQPPSFPSQTPPPEERGGPQGGSDDRMRERARGGPGWGGRGGAWTWTETAWEAREERRVEILFKNQTSAGAERRRGATGGFTGEGKGGPRARRRARLTGEERGRRRASSPCPC